MLWNIARQSIPLFDEDGPEDNACTRARSARVTFVDPQHTVIPPRFAISRRNEARRERRVIQGNCMREIEVKAGVARVVVIPCTGMD
jgi:phosphoribosylpyrophosphate synthetase